jgi:hypothetical protein
MRLILSLILTLIAAAVVGAAMVLLDKIGFYLIIVVPVFGGFIIGFAAALPYLGRKARAVSSGLGTGLSSSVVLDDRPSRLPFIIFTLLGVLIAQAVYWGGSYIMFQDEVVALIVEQEPSATREEVLSYLDTINMEEFGTTGFPAYVQTLAEEGISINRATSSSDTGGINLQGGLAYAFWVIEALVMWGIAISTAFGRARAVEEPQAAAAAS